MFWWLQIKPELPFEYTSSWVQRKEKPLKLNDLRYIREMSDCTVCPIVPSGLKLLPTPETEIWSCIVFIDK